LSSSGQSKDGVDFLSKKISCSSLRIWSCSAKWAAVEKNKGVSEKRRLHDRFDADGHGDSGDLAGHNYR
jgi:hypothetical protein